MNRTLVLNVVGLTPALVGEHTPALAAFARRGALRPLTTVTPAVTCSVQSTLITGLAPSGHGCVGNGWYYRDIAEINFWRQSNHLVSGDKIWDAARRRDPSFTCAVLFWWWNMYSTANIAVTPRPMFPADGRKLPDVHTRPADLRDHLQSRHGQFPAVGVRGPARRLRAEPLDRARRPRRLARAQADALARLPAAPRLRPPARGTRRPRHPRRTARRRRRVRRADRPRHRCRGAHHRRLRVRHHPRH